MEPAEEAVQSPAAPTSAVAPQESSPLEPGGGQAQSWEEAPPPPPPPPPKLLGEGGPCPLTPPPAHSPDVPPSPAGKEGAMLQPPQKALSLKVTLVRRRTGRPDSQLEERLQRRLRLLENDSQQAVAVLSELSARLLSIHSEDHLIAITFWTLEEIWKFITYYSLGFLTPCLETLLLDDSLWLSSPEDAAGIEVLLDEDDLHRAYRGLLVQEGACFGLCPENVGAAHPRAIGRVESAAPEQVGSGHTMEALEPPDPFHQWFLKAHAASDGLQNCITALPVTDQAATGLSTAVISRESAGPDEISVQAGDKIEIVGYFLKCMPWFVGRRLASGQVGFVPSSCVEPEGFLAMATELPCMDFFKEDGGSAMEEESLLDNLVRLLACSSQGSVCSLYQIDAQNDGGLQEPETAPPSSVDGEESPAPCRAVHSLMETKDFVPAEEETGQPPSCHRQGPPPLCFSSVCQEGVLGPDPPEALLSLLNREGYEDGFGALYDPPLSFLKASDCGDATEEQLMDYLARARTAARQADLRWATTRLCYLLGRMSLRRSKLSQARVYLEEALATLRGDFRDPHLVVSLYTHLTGIYLKQKNVEKSAPFLGKAASLLMGLAIDADGAEMALEILKHALQRALLSRSQNAEARACFLLAKHCLRFKQGQEPAPFLERLQQLLNVGQGLPGDGRGSVDCYLKLGQLYSQKCLPCLVLSCAKVVSARGPRSLPEMFRTIDLVLRNASKVQSPTPGGQTHPSLLAFYLRELLHALEGRKGRQKLRSVIYYELAQLHSRYKRYEEAIGYMEEVLELDTSGRAVEDTINHFISLSWLYILHQRNDTALSVLDAVAESPWSTRQQLGIIHNMVAISLRRSNRLREAAKSYFKALSVSRETGSVANEAVALANLGILCLHSSTQGLAEHFLVRAIQLFSRVPSGECGGNFVAVLLRLGHHYARGAQKEKGRSCYEWAFLVALEREDVEGQLQAVKHLCHFHSAVAPDLAQCVLYNEYLLTLVRKTSDKVMEGQVLETISRLYLSLGTERACRSALDYLKRSLGIFIDLQAKAKEAQAWLQAGRIYYALREDELVDVYIQVAHNTALSSQDPNLEMEMLEASGDIFFNGDWEKERAAPFYRDKALPLAVKAKNGSAELRLFNKLVGLFLTLQKYEECLGYAQTSLALSVHLGDQLSERVAYHRLAVIHHRLGQCELAEHFFLKAVSLCPSPLEFDEEALYYVKVYLLLGDITFYDLKDPFDAAGYYNLALAAAMDLGNKRAQLKIYTRLAVIYHNFLVDREMSLFFYQKARAFATELNICRINLSPDQPARRKVR
ncbi:SH3 domain and tetratricopeptide repeat-containing protein 1 isoform X2 [Erythrolamprus reginae]|uniref:SH3 domain and tetratricopeptide repeat-containing protein 1 isoform X2 n=1 Tax=Erythrolamprus reginae TaxID=121349 RepID=UPI00396CA6A3